jgi:hypothetical protein
MMLPAAMMRGQGRSALSKFMRFQASGDIFTFQVVFDLLPHREKVRLLDNELERLPDDLYDIETWKKYWLGIIFDEKDERKRLIQRLGKTQGNEEADRRQERRVRHLRHMLDRAAALHRALDVNEGPPSSITICHIGSDCEVTLDAALVLRDPKKPDAQYKTTFRPDGLVTKDKTSQREALYTCGDRRVTAESAGLNGHCLAKGVSSKKPRGKCFSHIKLVSDSEFTRHVPGLLRGNRPNNRFYALNALSSCQHLPGFRASEGESSKR